MRGFGTAAFAVLFGLGLEACSLLVDTGDLASDPGSAGPSAGDAGADADATSPRDAAEDRDAPLTSVYPSTATLWPLNGHAYEVVSDPDVTWADARKKAADRGGHLATVTSTEENEFLWKLVVAYRPSVINEHEVGPWLGALQQENAAAPTSDWHWVTGEPWAFTAWADGEPNEASLDERALSYYFGPSWADVRHDVKRGVLGYTVEYE